jgi:hypothetical protein
MGNHAAAIVAAAEGAMSAFPGMPQVLVGFFIFISRLVFLQDEKNDRADPLPFS